MSSIPTFVPDNHTDVAPEARAERPLPCWCHREELEVQTLGTHGREPWLCQ